MIPARRILCGPGRVLSNPWAIASRIPRGELSNQQIHIRAMKGEGAGSSQAVVARWYLRISATRARQYSRYIKLMSVHMTEPRCLIDGVGGFRIRRPFREFFARD